MSIANTVLMLSLISVGSKKGWLGITKLQKLSFLVEYHLSENEKRAFDYEFFMYDLGPISTGVYDDFEFLLNNELVVENEDGIRMTDLGESIEERFRNLIPKEISSAMQDIISEYASMKTDELVEMVHKMRIRLPGGAVMRIEDVPRNLIILPKPLDTVFKLGKDYIETLRILSDKSLMEVLREARSRGAKSKEYEPLASS